MDPSEAITTDTRLRPFGSRVVVVDVTEKNQGLVLPPSAYPLRRGVVVSAPAALHGQAWGGGWEPPQPGELIHYTEGLPIGDHFVVDFANIIAIEGG